MKPILFLDIGWMKYYQGPQGDKISDGGAFVKTNHFGHEMFNFLPDGDHVYGYAPVREGTINIEKLGAQKGAEHLDGVLVVWTARSPNTGGTRIVGFYRNARVYRTSRRSEGRSKRHFKGEKFWYSIRTKKNDAHLIDSEKRTFEIPRGKGRPGQAAAWFGASSNHKFSNEILAFLNGKKAPEEIREKPGPHGRYQQDIELRLKVERKAVEITAEYFEAMGFVIDPKPQQEKPGWDLTAKLNERELLIEVKGLSGSEVSVELTPNEFTQMTSLKRRDKYRLCVVTDALSAKPKLWIFSYSKQADAWVDESGRQIQIQPKTGATCWLE